MARYPGLAGPLHWDGPRTRPTAAGQGVPAREATHLSDPPFDDGFSREDPLAHCRQLHLAQRHPQPIILPACSRGRCCTARARAAALKPRRADARQRARSRSSCGPSRDPPGERAVARTSPSPGAVARESEHTRGGGRALVLKGASLMAGALAQTLGWGGSGF